MKAALQDGNVMSGSAGLLQELLTAIEARGVTPGRVEQDGKQVNSFIAEPPSTAPFCAAVKPIHKTYVQGAGKREGAYVTRTDLGELLSTYLGEPPDTALWRLSALVCWSKLAKAQRRETFPFDQLLSGVPRLPSVVEIAAALERSPPKAERNKDSWEALACRAPADDRWQTVALVTFLALCDENASGDAYRKEVASTIAETLLIAAIARDAKVSAESFEQAVRENRMPAFAPAVVDALLGTGGFLECVRRWGGIRLPNSHPLATWCAVLESRPYDISALPAEEYAVRRMAARLRTQYEPARALSEGSASEAVAMVHLLEHLEAIENHRYGFQHESHVVRATQAAVQARPLLPAFSPWILLAFAEKAGEELIDILSSACDEPTLERLRLFELGPERLNKVGAIADTILRRCGAIPMDIGNTEVRELVGPLEPIRGQTWLNDVRLEHLLHEAARRGEEAFATQYSKAWNEGEDDLLRDLFDSFLQAELVASVNEANRVARVPGRVWYLRWSKFSRQEEVHHGADLALEVKVAIHGRLAFEKTCFLQVKRMETKDDRFRSGWRLNARQRAGLIGMFGSSAFYLLLTPIAVSAQQRVIPVDVAGGILKERHSKEALSDSVAACCSHSLAHFLIFDVLAGWQGFPGAVAFTDPRSHNPRQGRQARYLLRIELGCSGNSQ